VIEQPRSRRGRLSGGIPFGRVWGVPILVAPSWVLTAVLLAAVYGAVLRDAVAGLSATTSYLAASVFALLFSGCVLAHEVGHTVVARALHYDVRRIVLFAMGGVSEMRREPARPRDALLTAGAGPLVSIALGGVAWLARDATAGSGLTSAVLVLLCWSNLVLAAFNLLPGLPLDGGHLLQAALAGCGCPPLTAARIAAWSGRLLAAAVAVGALELGRSPLGLTSGVLSLALAAYLWLGATQEWKLAVLHSRLPAIRVADLLRPGLLVPADLPVAEALRRAAQQGAGGLVVVDAADRPDAIVDEALIGAVPPERRPWLTVAQVARRLEPALLLPTDIDAEELLERMQAMPAHEYLAVDARGRPAGVISTRDFTRRLSRGSA
jgi:Zn-dependent protease